LKGRERTIEFVLPIYCKEINSAEKIATNGCIGKIKWLDSTVYCKKGVSGTKERGNGTPGKG